MRGLIVLALLAFAAPAAAAPFCVVDDRGRERCTFRSMEDCRDEARLVRGACVYKSESGESEADSNPWDWGGAVQRGLESGRQERRARSMRLDPVTDSKDVALTVGFGKKAEIRLLFPRSVAEQLLTTLQEFLKP